MKEKIQELRKKLQDTLDATRQRTEATKASIEASADKTKADIQGKINEAKAQVEKQKAAVEQARSDFKSSIDGVSAKIAEKKHDHAVKKAVKKVNKTEERAATLIGLTLVAMCEAEVAVLEAVEATMELDELLAEE